MRGVSRGNMAAGICCFCSCVDLSAWEILAQGSWEQLSSI